MKGIQLSALSLFNEETQELVRLLYPSRMTVSIESFREALMDGQIVEMGKAYQITATGISKHKSMIDSWQGQDVWLAGFDKEGNILQAYGLVAVQGDKLVFRMDCEAGYSEEGMHNSGMSFCDNALALWQWDLHPGQVFFPFNIDVTARFKGELKEIDSDGDTIMSHKLNGEHTFRPCSNALFFYIEAPTAKRPTLNIGQQSKPYSDFNV